MAWFRQAASYNLGHCCRNLCRHMVSRDLNELIAKSSISIKRLFLCYVRLYSFLYEENMTSCLRALAICYGYVDMLWTYFMSLPGVMYTGLYLISRSRIIAYLDDIVKFGDYRKIWRWYLHKIAVDLEYVISLAIVGSPANSQSKPLIFTA